MLVRVPRKVRLRRPRKSERSDASCAQLSSKDRRSRRRPENVCEYVRRPLVEHRPTTCSEVVARPAEHGAPRVDVREERRRRDPSFVHETSSRQGMPSLLRERRRQRFVGPDEQREHRTSRGLRSFALRELDQRANQPTKRLVRRVFGLGGDSSESSVSRSSTTYPASSSNPSSTSRSALLESGASNTATSSSRPSAPSWRARHARPPRVARSRFHTATSRATEGTPLPVHRHRRNGASATERRRDRRRSTRGQDEAARCRSETLKKGARCGTSESAILQRGAKTSKKAAIPRASSVVRETACRRRLEDEPSEANLRDELTGERARRRMGSTR